MKNLHLNSSSCYKSSGASLNNQESLFTFHLSSYPRTISTWRQFVNLPCLWSSIPLTEILALWSQRSSNLTPLSTSSGCLESFTLLPNCSKKICSHNFKSLWLSSITGHRTGSKIIQLRLETSWTSWPSSYLNSTTKLFVLAISLVHLFGQCSLCSLLMFWIKMIGYSCLTMSSFIRTRHKFWFAVLWLFWNLCKSTSWRVIVFKKCIEYWGNRDRLIWQQ